MMKIVASIPSYNSASTIKETILSLCSQTYPFFKIRVYDNQSTDNTKKIVNDLMSSFSNLELIVNEENLGAEGNFTKCIADASEDLCLIAHADDIYHKDFVKNAVEVFLNNQEVVATFCAANEINGRSEIVGKRFTPEELKKDSIAIMDREKGMSLFYRYGNFVTCPSVVARSGVLREKIRIWDGKTYHTSADLDVWMRLLEHGSMAFINKDLINYRVAEASYSYRIAKIRTAKHEIFRVLEGKKYEDYAKKFHKNLNFLLNKDSANRFLNVIRKKDKALIRSYQWEARFNFLSIFKVGISSFWHFKMMLAILVLRTIYTLARIL